MGEAILYQLHSLLAATALGFCRLAPTFYLLPFFASGNIPTVVRHPIIIVVSCALVQHYHYELLNLNEIDIALFAAILHQLEHDAFGFGIAVRGTFLRQGVLFFKFQTSHGVRG